MKPWKLNKEEKMKPNEANWELDELSDSEKEYLKQIHSQERD